jgi:prepilin-type N-terminal cleavage/methylation domain-containing protein
MNGFSLTELLVVIMVIGILAGVAVPHYYKTIEKDKSNEAVNLFLSLKASQDRFNAKYGAYCLGPVATCGIDTTPTSLVYFNAPGSFVAGGTGSSSSWALTLTRNSDPAAYGAYVLKYDVEPNAAPSLTCNVSACNTDLLPSAN